MTYSTTVYGDSPLYFLEFEGTTAKDTITGTTFTTSGTPTTGVAGKTGNAWSFINSADRVALTPYSGFYANAHAIEAWFKVPTGTAYREILRGDGGGQAALVRIEGPNTNVGKLQIHYNGVNSYAAVRVDDNLWHHVVVSSDGSTVTVYLDNAVVITASDNGITNGITDGWTVANFRDGTEPLTGALDALAVYTHSLSASRVAAHYRAAFEFTGWGIAL